MADGGTVYMAKTLSSAAKVRMAWDLNASNQVVVVDEYDIWEQLLGWEKLKCLPHGKNKIREELGDQLSDSVLQMVAGNDTSTNSDTKDTSDTSSRGRRTRTKPSEEVLNIAKGSAHKRRNRMKSKDIYDSLEDSNTITHTGISTLVLFPSTVDLNMTDHWWVAGRRSQDNGYVAIANCNKGTFEYLNQLDSVWHIEDYLNQASNYEFDTNTGPVTMNTVSTKNLVIHIVSEKTKSRLGDGRIIKNMPSAITEYVENEMFSRIKPELPHQDDMVYAPITEEESFWLRPMLRKEQDPKSGDAVICYGDVNVRDLGNTSSISSDYWLYSRARLPNWDFDAIELKKMDKASIYFDLDSGGYEMIEMLGELHDMGKCPFSKSPKSRW